MSRESINYLKSFEKKGISFLSTLSNNKLENLIRVANDYYYNDQSLLADSVYDILKEYVDRRFPENKTTKEVGAPIRKNKVKLPYYMASLDKIKEDDKALTKWVGKFKGPYLVSAKLDGISILYTTEGKSPKLYTRGRALEGLDVSHLIPYLNLPSIQNITIRGELIIDIKTFNSKYKGQYKSPRNFIGGVVNSKTKNPSKWKSIHFVAYELIKPSVCPSKQLKWLHDKKVKTVAYHQSTNLSLTLLSKYLIKWRNDYTYETDGVVVMQDAIHPRTNKNPKHAFAFKMVLTDQMVEAKVTDIIWNVSKDGYLKPVIRINPVTIRGATIEYITAYNAKFVKDNHLGVGAIIKLIRSGDVIPKIEKILQPGTHTKMPTGNWKWNENKVDALSLDSKIEVNNKTIEYFFKQINTDHLGPGNIKKIINAGYDTIPKVVKLTKKELLTIDGFKEKTANKIYNTIQTQLKEVSLARVMAASNIFGRGMGRKRIQNILDVYPTILTDKKDNKTKMKLIAELNGFGIKTAKEFVPFIERCNLFLREIGWKHKKESKKKIPKHPLNNKNIVFSGFRDKILQKEIESLGGMVKSSVSKNTFMVVVKSLQEDTSKAKKARKLGVPLSTPSEFKIKYI